MDLPVSQNSTEQTFRISSRICVLDDSGRRRLLVQVLNPHPAGSKHTSNCSPKNGKRWTNLIVLPDGRASSGTIRLRIRPPIRGSKGFSYEFNLG